MEGIKKAFAKAKSEGRAPLVAYWTAGYPTNEDAAPIMLGMQRGGVEVVGHQFLSRLALFMLLRPTLLLL